AESAAADATPSAGARAVVEIDDVSKVFGDFVAVDHADFAIHEGEFFSMLGPSGCGKTTTMRMIAGFEEPTAGNILLRGRDVVGIPPNKRDVNMCFQHYALFPHMSVGENIAYGLKLRKVAKDERARQVDEMLDLVGLPGYAARRPNQLSGGQQQRVALARALVNRPTALLLDEPLGALDVKLRLQMRLELKRIQHELGTTFVFVTHDQDEALSMSDRIAVMNQGVIDQIGSPREIYEHPATPFVADFVGVLNAMRLRVDEVSGRDGVARVSETERIVIPGADHVGEDTLVAVRPERIRIAPGTGTSDDASRVTGRVAQVVYLGTLTQFHVDTSLGETLVVHRLSDEPAAAIAQGDEVTLAWDREDAAILLER
ncbi:MAG TPA: ABC transporter ATP-binding protein, partial [Actinomycetota bacterium]